MAELMHVIPVAQSDEALQVLSGYGPHALPHSVAESGDNISIGCINVPTVHWRGGFSVRSTSHGVDEAPGAQFTEPSTHSMGDVVCGTMGSALAFAFSLVHTAIELSMVRGIP